MSEEFDFDKEANQLNDQLAEQVNPAPLMPLIVGNLGTNFLIELNKAMKLYDIAIKELATKIWFRIDNPNNIRFLLDNKGFELIVPTDGYIINLIQPERDVTIDFMLRAMISNPSIYIQVIFKSFDAIVDEIGTVKRLNIPFCSFVYWTKDQKEAYRMARLYDAQVFVDMALGGVIYMADPQKADLDGGHFEPESIYADMIHEGWK